MTGTLRAGDQVQVTCGLASAPGRVLLVSRDGGALELAIDGTIDGQTVLLPVQRDGAGVFRSFATGRVVTVQRPVPQPLPGAAHA